MTRGLRAGESPALWMRFGFRVLPGLLAWAAAAHVVSMSSGELAIDGLRGHFELRMPLYEIAHVPQPESTLLDNIRFSSGGRAANTLTRSSRAEPAVDTYICTADYEFAVPVEALVVECTFAAVTVPNHVHVLRVSMGDRHDQGFFDRSFTRETLRFRPPTATEIALSESGAGFMRALGGAVQIL